LGPTGVAIHGRRTGFTRRVAATRHVGRGAIARLLSGAAPRSALAVITALLATRSARGLATAPRAITAARTLRACASRITTRAIPHGRIHVEALGRDDRHLLLQQALDLAEMFL